MEKFKKYIPTILALIAVTIVIRLEIINATSNKWFVLDFIDTFISYGLGLLIAIPTLYYSIKQLEKGKSKIHFLPLAILGIGTLTIIGLLTFGHIKNKSPIVFTAIYDGDTNGININLRQDKTYVIENYSVLGGEFFEGNYTIIEDTIILDNLKPLGNDNNFITNKLIIKEDKVLFSCDKKGKYDTDYFTMKIKENRLKN